MKFPKVKRKSLDSEPRQQFAALPWRNGEAGLEFMLLTSRDTRRWVIPKGWPMKGRKPHMTAALEALQEAGLLGRVEKKPIGCFLYRKRLKNGAVLLCKVDVFPMRVLRQRKNWPEKNQRLTRWTAQAEAADFVAEAELKEIILSFNKAKPAERVA